MLDHLPGKGLDAMPAQQPDHLAAQLVGQLARPAHELEADVGDPAVDLLDEHPDLLSIAHSPTR